MSESVIAYVVTEGPKHFLMVLDEARGGVHRFPMNTQGLSRLSAETARAVNGDLGGFNLPLANGK